VFSGASIRRNRVVSTAPRDTDITDLVKAHASEEQAISSLLSRQSSGARAKPRCRTRPGDAYKELSIPFAGNAAALAHAPVQVMRNTVSYGRNWVMAM
jgi:hypothetical protein